MRVVKYDEKTWERMQSSPYAYTLPPNEKKHPPKVKIPEEYKFIRDEAFQGDMHLKRIELSSGCQVIGINAFASSAIKHPLILPDSLRVIENGAFAKCKSLRKVYLANIIKIGIGAFEMCDSLEEVQIAHDAPLRIISVKSFNECKRLKGISLPNQLVKIEDRAFYRCKELNEIALPDTLRTIGEECFYFNGFQTLQLPEKLENLGASAFFKCTKLEYVKIPESVKIIGKWAFHGCNRLKVMEILHEPAEMGEWIMNRSTIMRCREGSKVDQYCRKFNFQTQYI